MARTAWRALVLGSGLAAWLSGAATLAQAQGESDPPAASANDVVHVRIAGALDIGTQSLVRRAIRRAAAGPERLVIEIDTPGGEIELMFQLATQIADASKDGTLTVAWVHDKALSAGALVAIACERVYMSSQSTIGSALPVVPSQTGGIEAIQDEAAREKVSSAVRATFRAFAESHGRSPAVADAMVDPDLAVFQIKESSGELRLISKSEWDDRAMTPEGRPHRVRTVNEEGRLLALSGAEAVELGFADGLAESLEAVFDKIGVRGAEALTVQRTRSEDVAAFLDQIKFLLLIGGLMAIYAEFKAPGFGLPGIAAILCFALLLFGRYLVGLANVPHIVAVAGGLILIAVELFVLPGTIWFALVGGVLVIGGLVLANIAPGLLEHELSRELALEETFKLTLSMLAAVAGAVMMSRWLPKVPVFGRLILQPTEGLGRGMPELASSGSGGARQPRAGELGRALTDLRPVGKVALDVDGEREYEARSEGAAIEQGARVRLVDVRAGRLIVELEEGTAT
jgi:membrane-bound serine protease (ClpP class)